MLNTRLFAIIFMFFSISFSQVFFSEYAEGSSNHKYLEIYNGTAQNIDLTNYAFPNATNGADIDGTYDYWNVFSEGASVLPGDVYVICHGSADDFIQAECDQNHTYLSNGDDGFCLVEGTESSFNIIDCIGTWGSTDPGNGWDVAGVTDATKDHTLVRKSSVLSGNLGNWSSSAGTSTDDSEWIVYEQNTWDYLGSHSVDNSGEIYGCTDSSACNFNSNATVDNGSCTYPSDLFDCDGNCLQDLDECGTCGGDGTNCDGTGLYFSEYAEGSSNHKYLEIYNGTSQTVDLSNYAYPNATNGANTDGTYDYWNSFDAGATIAPGDVYVLCHPSADDFIQAECDQTHTYLSNGDDGFCLVEGSESSFSILDCIGTWSETDPGNGWDVAGVTDATKDHTLVRLGTVASGNYGNWELSAGASAADSEWVVFEQNTWTYIGSHPHDFSNIPGCTDSEAANYNPNATSDDGSCQYAQVVTIQDIQGTGDISPLDGQIVQTTGIVTGVSYAGFFIQNGTGPWSGLWVYVSSPTVSSGDEVQVSGNVEEYNGLTEIAATSIVVLSSGNALPAPELLSTGMISEQYEGVRVELLGATCTMTPNEYGEWEVNDGSGPLLIDDRLATPDAQIYQGFVYDVVGVVDCYNTFKLQATEINFEEGQNIPPTAVAGDDLYVEYNFVVTLDGQQSYDSDGSIVSYFWSQTEGVPVFFGEPESPIISFVAPNEFTTIVFSLQVTDNEGSTSTDFITVNVGNPSIYDIQFTADAGSDPDCYPSSYIGQELTLTGIVTAVRDFSSYPNFYIQQEGTSEWGGIYAYVPSGITAPSIGDNISVTGIIAENYGVTQITQTSNGDMPITVNSVSNTLEPVQISVSGLGPGNGCTSASGSLESMFVELIDLSLMSIDQYGTWIVSDSNGNSYMIDDYMFNSDLGPFPAPAIGTVISSVKGVVGNYFDYKIYPRSINDIVFGDGGGGTDYIDASILEVQSFTESGTGDDCYPSLVSGNYVSLNGIVTAVNQNSSHPDFWIQDFSTSALGGVFVYTPSSFEALQVGDEVNLNGQVEEYYGLTEIKNITDVEVVSSNNATQPLDILTGDLGTSCSSTGELYEGMLVKISDVTVDSISVEYNSIYLNDGTGSVKVDDYIFYDYDLPDTSVDFTSISDSFVSITGVVHYYFGEYVIYPRNWDDFQITLEECSYNGDANLDGVVNVIDIVQTVNVILDENIILTESELCIIDYNSDGIANVIDIVALVNLILGIE